MNNQWKLNQDMVETRNDNRSMTNKIDVLREEIRTNEVKFILQLFLILDF